MADGMEATAQAKTNVFTSPIWQAGQDDDDPAVRPFDPKWYHYLSRELGIGIMAKAEPTPPFYVKLQAFGIYVTIVVAILTGFWWSYQQGEQAQAARDAQQAQIEKLKAEIEAAKAQANTATKDAHDALTLSAADGTQSTKEKK